MRTVIIPASAEQELLEEIISVRLDYLAGLAEIVTTTGELGVDGVFVPDMSTTRVYQVNFNQLMESKPSWSPSKPKNEFRRADIFALMSLNGQTRS